MPVEAGEIETRDQFLRGRLVLRQPRRGARAGLDPLLLAAFAQAERPRPGRVVDLGAGTGIVGLALATLAPVSRLALVELQPRLVELARANCADAGLGERSIVVEGDLRRATSLGLGAHEFDLAVANPPYTRASSGDRAADVERARSRHELTITIADVARAAATLVGGGGRLAVVFPAARLTELLGAVSSRGFGPRVLRTVHSTVDAPARLVLCLAHKGYRGGITIRPPLVVHVAGNAYAPEVEGLLYGGPDSIG